MASKLTLHVVVDALGTGKLDTLSDKLTRTGRTLNRNVTLPLAVAGAAMFKFASDAEESTSKAQTVFGDAFQDIAQDAKNLDDAFSESQFLDTAGTFGAIAQGMGETQEESAALSKQWLSMAQDFASFNNLSTEETLTAIRSALTGEFEPLKRMGILLNVAKVEAKALELGLIKEGEALTDNARLLATNALILEQIGPAQGDYARTADGAANSIKNLSSNAQDLAANFGEALLPVGIQIIGMLTGLVAVFTSLPEPVQTSILVLGGLALAIGPLLTLGGSLLTLGKGIAFVFLNLPTALGLASVAFSKVGAAFSALKVLLLANPFVALAAAVIAIAALIILNWDKIVEFLRKVWNIIIGAILGFADRLRTVWEGIVDTVKRIWDTIVGIIKGAINGVIDVINGFFGFLNGIQIGIPAIDVGPIHVGGGVIDPFNIGLIPRLAEGGIVDSATLALIGEKGPEAVVPLDKLGGDTHFHSHIEVRGEDPFIRNESDLVRANQRIAFLEGF